jgi:hypothetical protein
MADFKPNIYPVMYWALAYGAVAGVALFIMFLLSRFVTVIWFPVFLVGFVWGGYRNYQKQKAAYHANSGVAPVAQSPVNEFRQAVADVANATQDMMASQTQEQAEEDLQQAEVEGELPLEGEEATEVIEEQLPGTEEAVPAEENPNESTQLQPPLQ